MARARRPGTRRLAAGVEDGADVGCVTVESALHGPPKKSRTGKMKAQFEKEQSDSGEFQRQEDAFREWISNDGSTPYPAVPGRYHLYVSLACPWASRTVIFRKLKRLEDAIGMTIVDPIRDEKGWAFRDPSGKTQLDAP